MHYIDWVVGSMIFLFAVVFVLIALPQFLPERQSFDVALTESLYIQAFQDVPVKANVYQLNLAPYCNNSIYDCNAFYPVQLSFGSDDNIVSNQYYSIVSNSLYSLIDPTRDNLTQLFFLDSNLLAFSQDGVVDVMENFEDEAINDSKPLTWVESSGSWTASNRYYFQSNSDVNGLSYVNGDWSDLFVETIFKPNTVDVNGLGLVFRLQDSSNYYACEINNALEYDLVKYSGGVKSNFRGVSGDLTQDEFADFEADTDVNLNLVVFKDSAMLGLDVDGNFEETAIGAGVNIKAANKNGMQQGVNWVDFDNDGDLDLHVVYGGRADELYRNDGNFNFTNIAVSAGLANAQGGQEANWVDYDNDGDQDVYLIIRGAANKLFRNNGDSTFTEVTGTAKVGGQTANYNRAAAWGDYDNDGDIDLYLTGDNANTPNQLFRNDLNGEFSDVTAEHVGLNDGNVSYEVSFVDIDSDGDMDIFLPIWVSNTNRLFRNDNGTFVEITNPIKFNAAATDACWGDYDNDGDIDVGLAAYGNTNIFRNDGGLSFTNVKALTAWNYLECAWGDYDNDGDLDLVVGKKDALWRNDGSDVFTDVSSLVGISSANKGAAFAWGDYDNDGDLDLFVGGNNNYFYRNSRDDLNYLVVRLDQNDLGLGDLNHDLGAKVRVFDQQSNLVCSRDVYEKGSSNDIHCGVDYNGLYDVNVTFFDKQTFVIEDQNAHKRIDVNGVSEFKDVNTTFNWRQSGYLESTVLDSGTAGVTWNTLDFNEWYLYGQADVFDENFIAFYRFDENTGVTSKDAGFNARTGNLGGTGNPANKPTWVTGRNGISSGLMFDGDDNFMSCYDFLGGAEFSFEVWIKSFDASWTDPGNREWRMIYDQTDHTFLYLQNDSNVYWVVSSGAGVADVWVGSSKKLDVNKWNFLAGTYDSVGGVIKLYINGVEASVVQSGTPSVAVVPSTCSNYDMGVGATWGGNTDNFHGVIDDLKFYSKELTGKEIWNHYQASKADIKFQFRTDADNASWPAYAGPDGSINTYYYDANVIDLNLTNNRYLQFKAFFETSDNNITPLLDFVSVNYGSETNPVSLASFDFNGWHSLKAKAVSSSISCFFDDNELVTATDSSFVSGGVGFETIESKVLFDDLKVSKSLDLDLAVNGSDYTVSNEFFDINVLDLNLQINYLKNSLSNELILWSPLTQSFNIDDNSLFSAKLNDSNYAFRFFSHSPEFWLQLPQDNNIEITPTLFNNWQSKDDNGITFSANWWTDSIFFDAFEDNNANDGYPGDWNEVSGNWQVLDSNYFELATDTNHTATIEDINYSNYVFKTKFKVANVGQKQVEFLVRYIDSKNFLAFVVSPEPASRNLEIRRYVNGVYTLIASADKTMVLNSWYNAKIYLDKDAIKFRVWRSIDSESSSWDIDSTDSGFNPGVNKGGIGLRAIESQLVVADVNVMPLYNEWLYRLPVSVNTGTIDQNFLAETKIDFSKALSRVSDSRALDANSIRVVEYSDQFTDNFNDANGWVFRDGNWFIENEMLKQGDLDDNSNAFVYLPHSNIDLQFTMKFDSNTHAMVYSHLQDSLKRFGHSAYIVDQNADSLTILKVSNDVKAEQSIIAAAAIAGTQYFYRITITDGLIKVWRDGTYLGSWQDSVPLRTGKFIAFDTVITRVSIDDFNVSSLDRKMFCLDANKLSPNTCSSVPSQFSFNSSTKIGDLNILVDVNSSDRKIRNYFVYFDVARDQNKLEISYPTKFNFQSLSNFSTINGLIQDNNSNNNYLTSNQLILHNSLDDNTTLTIDLMREDENNSSWVNLGYSFKKPLIVSSSIESLDVNYSVRVGFDTQSLIAAGKVLSDCNDVKVFDLKGNSLLDTIVMDCNSVDSNVFFKLQRSLPANTTSRDYAIAYGKSNAVFDSNALKALVAFDNFDDGNEDDGDPIDWDEINVSWAIVNKQYTQVNSSSVKGTVVDFVRDNNFWVDANVYIDETDATAGDHNVGIKFQRKGNIFYVAQINYTTPTPANPLPVALVKSNQIGPGQFEFQLLDFNDSTTINFQTWYKLSVKMVENNIKVFVDNNLLIDFNDSSPLPPGDIGLVTRGSKARFDNFSIRRAVLNPETVTVGNETKYGDCDVWLDENVTIGCAFNALLKFRYSPSNLGKTFTNTRYLTKPLISSLKVITTPDFNAFSSDLNYLLSFEKQDINLSYGSLISERFASVKSETFPYLYSDGKLKYSELKVRSQRK
ncbi:MAG: FG-GAP-like repeat-containing protein [archaeon]